MKSTINLFKALPIVNKKKEKASKGLLESTLKRGFLFAPEVVANYTEGELLEIIKDCGLTAEQMNSSFHKSWNKIKTADLEQLVVEQLAHYLTTYGKENPEGYIEEKGEQWGVDNLGGKIIGLGDFKSDKVGTNYVYIPKEKLEIPELKDDIKLVVIKGLTKKELKEKLMELLSTGIALAEKTIEDIIDVALFVELTEKEIEEIKNKEVKIIMYEKLDLIPENQVEFLRYVIYLATKTTLVIKSPGLIAQIKETENKHIAKVFEKYKKDFGLERLAEIFYRFKPLFLAFRTDKELKKIINKVRRLAVTNHRPMKEDYLNSITAKIKHDKKISTTELEKALDGVNTFRKIRLAYALKYRLSNPDSILYKIRNGKGFAKEFVSNNASATKRILDIILASITKDVSKNVKGKKVYVPENMEYTLPATEKQFTGNFPSGSYVKIPKDMVMGIYWDNVKSKVIDLDLSLISPDTGKIGWDDGYRTDDKKILFSGDITDAKNGASELFYVRKQTKDAFIMFVNYYNFMEDVEVPFKIVVGKEEVKNMDKNYMLDPNNVVTISETTINQREKILGIVVTRSDECRFYFSETYIGGSITSSQNEFVENSRKYLFNFYENTIGLKDVLEKAGAKFIEDKEKADIDLSIESLDKTDIINLLK